MDNASFEKLIQDQPPDVKAKGILLFNGVLKGKTAYQAEPIVAKLKDWRASEAALDEFIASLGSGPTNEKTFTGIPAVVEYLHSQGWKISLRTGYNHRDKKLLLPRKDGKYYQSDVDRYAQTGALPRLDGIKQEITDSEIERKKRADADIAEYDARIKRIKAEAMEGKYVDREVFENELAVQALAFRNSIQTYVHAQAEEIVSFTGGDVSKIPDLIEFMMDRADEHFKKYAEEWEKKGPLIDIDKIETDEPDDKEEPYPGDEESKDNDQ
jgi:hypothetical protein